MTDHWHRSQVTCLHTFQIFYKMGVTVNVCRSPYHKNFVTFGHLSQTPVSKGLCKSTVESATKEKVVGREVLLFIYTDTCSAHMGLTVRWICRNKYTKDINKSIKNTNIMQNPIVHASYKCLIQLLSAIQQIKNNVHSCFLQHFQNVFSHKAKEVQ